MVPTGTFWRLEGTVSGSEMSPELSKAVEELTQHLLQKAGDRQEKVLAMARMLSATPSSTQPDGSTVSQGSAGAPATSQSSGTFSLEDYLADSQPALSREVIKDYLKEI